MKRRTKAIGKQSKNPLSEVRALGFTLLICLGLLSSACRPRVSIEELATVLDLVAGLPTAEMAWESGRIDLGEPAATRHLGIGWSFREKASGQAYRWGVGSRSEIEFFAASRRPLELTFRAWARPAAASSRQPTEVLLNDQKVTSIVLSAEQREYVVPLPAAGILVGSNRLTFVYPSEPEPRSARRKRDLRVAFAWISFAEFDSPKPRADEDAAKLRLDAGSRIDYFIRTSPGALLFIETLEGSEEGFELEISRRWQGGEDKRLFLPDTRQERIILPLGEDSGLLRLRLQLRSPTAARRSWVELTRPAILQPPQAATKTVADVPQRDLPAEPANVILYLVDTLRNDRLHLDDDATRQLPELRSLAADGVRFERFYAQSSWTLPTMASIFTGLWPRAHGVQRKDARLPGELPTIPGLLQQAGVETAAIVANGYVSAAFGFARGFDHFTFLPDFDTRAETIHQHALRWLDREPRPERFFLYLHLIDPHASYDPPADLRAMMAPHIQDPATGTRDRVQALREGRVATDRQTIDDHLALYDAEIVHVDRQLGRFLSALRERGLYDDSLILFLSDHGEEFFDHGSWTHGHTLFGELLDVPLIAKFPRRWQAGRNVSQPVQQIDILPTVLETFAIPPPAGTPGHSLRQSLGPLPASRLLPRPVYASLGNRLVSVVLEPWKLILRPARAAGYGRQLFDLSNDPGETENLAASRPLLTGYLTSLARQAMLDDSSAPVAKAVIDEATQENLRALGYLN